jgi:hypothetical protein
MKQFEVQGNVTVDFRTPYRRMTPEEQVEPATPDSSLGIRATKRRQSLFHLYWERDPVDESKLLEPPQRVTVNQMFAIEFRVAGPEKLPMIAYFYAHFYPDDNFRIPLGVERTLVDRLERVALYIPRTGTFTVEIVFNPDHAEYRAAIYRHTHQTTVTVTNDSDAKRERHGHSSDKALTYRANDPYVVREDNGNANDGNDAVDEINTVDNFIIRVGL